MKPEQVKPRKQCKICPWKVSTDPRKIPGGYCEAKHRDLAETVTKEASFRGFGGALRAMACHETRVGRELPCVGWMYQQLGPGNNIALRLAVMTGRIDGNFEVVGEQHERFEDTLPKPQRRKRSR